jgi:DNA-binding response OmpR family regulator
MANILVAQSREQYFYRQQSLIELAGHEISLINDIHELSAKQIDNKINGIVLDEALASTAEFDSINTLKKQYMAPVLVCIDSADEEKQSLYLELGADDVINKQATSRLWKARLNALLRKRDTAVNEQLDFGALIINASTRQVSLNEQMVHLTSHEFDLLLLLASNAGQIVSRKEVYEKVIGKTFQSDTRTVDVRVSRLRKKLQDDLKAPSKIKTIWKQGYLFVNSEW